MHHAVVIGTYSLVLGTGAMHFWAVSAGLVEWSNPCLSVLQLMRISNFGRGTAFELANGASLWIAFLFARVLGLPLWLYCYASDVRRGAWAAEEAGAALWTL